MYSKKYVGISFQMRLICNAQYKSPIERPYQTSVKRPHRTPEHVLRFHYVQFGRPWNVCFGLS